MKTVLLVLLMFTVSSPQWLDNFDSAKRIASAENKLILLSFSGSDWCGPCIRMKKEVFESTTFLSLADAQLVLMRADFPRSKKNQLSKEQTQHNEALAEKYNPEGKFPFTLLLDKQGNIVQKWDGYVFESQDKFIADLTAAIPAH